MSDDKNKKTAVEAAKALSKAMKQELEKFKQLNKSEYSPREAGIKVTNAIKEKIAEYQEQLVKMRSLENGEPLNKSTPPNISEKTIHELKDEYGHDKEGKEKAYATAWKISKKKSLKKNLYGLEGTPESNMEIAHQSGLAKQNVFDILASKANKSQMCKADLELKSDSEKDSEKSEPSAPKAVLPSDKPAESQDDKDTGSGGQIKKNKLSKAIGDEAPNMGSRASGHRAPSPVLKPKYTKEMHTGLKAKMSGVAQKLPSDVAPKIPKQSSYKVDKSEMDGLSKALVKPKIGGKDVSSVAMTHDASKDAHIADMKNKKMPTNQQSSKMPSMEDHAARADMYSEFMPKWNKSELETDMTKMDEFCGSSMEKAAAIGDPTWDKGYNVHHEAPHGTYRSSGALKSGKNGVELHYTPKNGKSKSLGFHTDKHAATAARLAHHDRISAGFKKDEQE